MQYVYYSFLVLNVLTFIITAYDKKLAFKKQNRVPENKLLLLVAIGGTIGGLLAMLIFKHKTSKISYLIKFFIIVILQILLILLLFKYDYIQQIYTEYT